jgi:hypothetical protein
MYRRRNPSTPVNRRGLVLLVVLALLTLFMVVALTFVYYADNELESSKLALTGQAVSQPDLDPETAGFYALGQILYGTQSGAPNIGLAPGFAYDADGLYSMIRGHELARTIYGFRDDPLAENSWAFSGTGRLHQNPSFLTNAGLTVGPMGQDDFFLVNYMGWNLAMPGQPPGPNNPVLPYRDPERNGTRTSPIAPYAANSFTGTANPPYTYPDLNNMLLAAVDPSGNILAISGHREALFGRLDDPNNVNWNNPEGKHLILRPRPADNPPLVVNGVTKPGFPMPEERWGDVKNLIGAPGGNDSIWIDIGAPVQTLPDGRKYKMLIAPLIMDLDGRVNLNVHGNILGKDANNNTVHASNQGLGKWEINLSKVLNADAAPPQEWKNVFLGNQPKGPYGRYGLDMQPVASGSSAAAFRSSPYYSRLDFNARNDPPNPPQPSAPLQVPIYGNPAPANSPPLSLFPSFLAAGGYGDGLPASGELLNHPLLYNFFRAGGDDRVFPASSMEAVLRYGDTNSPALTSDLFRLMPVNLTNPQVRRLVTTHSSDIDRPGILPYIWDPADQANAGTKYTLQSLPNGIYPRGNPITFPPLTNRANTPANSEFDPATWRAISAALGRIDLNSISNFQTYPAPVNGYIDMTVAANATQFNAAQGQRQQMAKRIYTALRAATGAIADPAAAPNPETPDFQALRWLAQLSVNIVDYIDYDDISTPFNWYTDTTATPAKPYYVFGTELPRVVLNEAYAEISIDPAVATQFRVKFWVELLNPLSGAIFGAGGPVPPDDGTARLGVPAAGTNPAYGCYQVVITGPNTNLAKPDNVLGDPDSGGAGNPNLKLVVSDFNTAPALPASLSAAERVLIHPLPSSTYSCPNGQNQGFYLLGPQADPFPSDAGVPVPPAPIASLHVQDQQFPLATPNPLSVTSAYQTPPITTYQNSMVYTVPNTTPANGIVHSILLRRLACPHLNPQLDPTKPNYNPYITVDYLDSVPVNDAVTTDANFVATALRASVGRREPFAASPAQVVAQVPSPANTLQPQHTLFRHNAREAAPANNNPDPLFAGGQTLQIPFHWLTHLNRQLVSPGELLQVSAFKPHELTHQFVTGAALPGVPYQHLAPWFDPAARIYRGFEIFETGDRAAGMSVGGRWPGKVNINTIWPQPDPNNNNAPISPVFRAVCDAQSSNSNYFGYGNGNAATPDATVDAIFKSFVNRRSPNLLAGNGLSLNDRPFLGMSPGPSPPNPPGDPQYPNGNGIENTLFASTTGNATPTDPRMFGVPVQNGADPNQAHPYQQSALLTKIFSNVTTRSNVFAVWITVGFFEVNNDTVRPVQLGAELNRSENRHIRHRVFAIVDRTNLSAYSTTSQGVTLSATPADPKQTPPAPQQVQVTLGATSGVDPRTGRQWQIQVGSVLVFDPNDPNGNEETVLITQPPAGNIITANFTKNHPAGGTVISRGNPGPWTRYDARQDNLVVPYFSVID